jgi:hypothetical protein
MLTGRYTDRQATLVPGGYFPDDLDTTSLALVIQPPTQHDIITSLLNRMAQYVNPDGSIMVRLYMQTVRCPRLKCR